MNILITGARGFVGKNLTATLQSIQNGCDRTHPTLSIDEIFCYDLDTDPALLEEYGARCDFVFHLAGVNRPQETREFQEGNVGFTSLLLDTLRRKGNRAPVLVTSSIQAVLDNPYGQSKRAGEELIFAYGEETGAPVHVYRLPGVFGKWCRPHYNSVVATFCHHIARGQPITINDPATRLELVYIDDLIGELIAVLEGRGHWEGRFGRVPVSHEVTLEQLAALLYSFRESRHTLSVPGLDNPFEKKLYSTYLSYLPEDGFSYPLKSHVDERGSFTEILRTADRGQFSVNITRPGVTRGHHWHHTKNEKFLVVSGTGVIRFRRLGSAEVIEYPVGGDRMEVVDIPVGYTHSIENTGQTDLITFMWANEAFDPEHPDTYFEKV
ncbi:MAG: capsular polysaccharide biosynthesis protein CapF [Clostridiales bacterium]|nr:capsular polysaccharide biosynthesis protein CapF [Clostridiales bacterium]